MFCVVSCISSVFLWAGTYVMVLLSFPNRVATLHFDNLPFSKIHNTYLFLG